MENTVVIHGNIKDYDMEKETTNICEFCEKFDKGKCTMHKVEVCYNDEACRDFIEGEKGGKK